MLTLISSILFAGGIVAMIIHPSFWSFTPIAVSLCTFEIVVGKLTK